MLRGKTPIKRNLKLQTENYKDIYKNDWAQSRVCKLAMRREAEKREIKVNIEVTSDECNSEEGVSLCRSERRSQSYSELRHGSNKKIKVEVVQQQNAQDPDT